MEKKSINDEQDLGFYGNYYSLSAASQYFSILDLSEFTNSL
jgi:hypothetical protein